MPRKCFILLFLAVLGRTTSPGAVYVVDDSSGNDANLGLLQSGPAPWSQAKKTITAAVNAAGNGDEVWIAQGNYNLHLFGPTESMPFNLVGKDLFIGGGFKVGSTTRAAATPMSNATNLFIATTAFALGPGSGNGSQIDGIRFHRDPNVITGGSSNPYSEAVKTWDGSPKLTRNWFMGLITDVASTIISCKGGNVDFIRNLVISCGQNTTSSSGVVTLSQPSGSAPLNANVHSNLFASINQFGNSSIAGYDSAALEVSGDSGHITNNTFLTTRWFPVVDIFYLTSGTYANNLHAVGNQMMASGPGGFPIVINSGLLVRNNAFQYVMNVNAPITSPYSLIGLQPGDLFNLPNAGVSNTSGTYLSPPNHHLLAGSPCINAASTALIKHGFDLDGQSRATGILNPGNEIGCDEVRLSWADIKIEANVFDLSLAQDLTGDLDVVATADDDPPISQRVAIGESGEIQATFQLKPGIYKFTVKKEGFLSSTRRNILIGEDDVLGLRMRLFAGDADGDGTIGTDDYIILNNSFDTGIGEPNWDPRADFNGDGFVTTDDYLILSENFDQVAEDY